MKNKTLYFALIALVAAGAVSGLVSSYKKSAVERDNTSVEIVMDRADILKISLRDGVHADIVLKKLKDAGLTSISVTESTLEELQIAGKLAWLTGYETGILDKIHTDEKEKTQFSEKRPAPMPFRKLNPAVRSLIRSAGDGLGYSYVVAPDKDSFMFAKNGLSLMLGSARVRTISEGTLLVMDDEEDLLSLGIGIPEKDIADLTKKGFYVIPRLKNNYRLDGAKLSSKLVTLLSYAPFTKVIFDGEEIAGYKNNIRETAAALKEHGIDFGYIEMAGQKGDSALLSAMGADIVRVHSIAEDEMQKRMNLKEAVSRFERAFYERGVRVLFIRPFYIPEKGSTLTDTNASYIANIRNSITKTGSSVGEAQSLAHISGGRASLILLALGLSAALLLVLRNYFSPSALHATVLFVASAAVFSVSRELSALGAAVIFPVLAVTSAFNLKDERPRIATISKAISMVLVVFFISLAGGLYVTGALADTAFMTGARQFAGVKVSFILPLIAVGIYWAINSGHLSGRDKISALLERPVTVAMLLLSALAAGIGAVYILRSGNFGIGVLDIERLIRTLLENTMSVRPRTKEFLIGYPALFLGAVYYLRNKKDFLWAFLIIGAIGPVSTINTFCHAHSPFMISVLRSFYGALLGILAGMVYHSAFGTFRKIVKK